MDPTQINGRTSDFPIDPMFLERWSPRAFAGEPISEPELLTILEAARWAPSSYNSQPWRFIFARRDTPDWERQLNLLSPFNRAWAKDASALVILISHRFMRKPGEDADVPSPTHSFDAGAASGYLALQAIKNGWFVHAMGGFDKVRAVADLAIPKEYQVEAAYAIGKRGDPSKLPEALRVREHPSPRLALKDIAFEGTFGRRLDL
ncbi:MAG TPA: nitroreductase family protein [Methylocella sp.]|nr:nitroreductase family protein [Methylocella sp.]